MDRNRHMATRTSTATTKPAPDALLVGVDSVLGRFPAGHPRGSRPAEEFAAARRAEGQDATVVMDLATDTFVVKAVA